MMQFVVGAAVVVVALAVGLVLRRRQHVDVPTQPEYAAPTQLDRNDFADRDAPWLVVVFSSTRCDVCADVVRKAQVLANAEVAVVEVEYDAMKPLHTKYRIDAVPIVAVADRDGVVRTSFIGPVTATDLWAAFAAVHDSAP